MHTRTRHTHILAPTEAVAPCAHDSAHKWSYHSFAAVISIVKLAGFAQRLLSAYELDSSRAVAWPEAADVFRAAALRGLTEVGDGMGFGWESVWSLGAAAFAWLPERSATGSAQRAEATGYSWQSAARAWSFVQPYLQISCTAPSVAWEVSNLTHL